MGLGWREAHNPWSCEGKVNLAEHLLKHLTCDVISLEMTNVVPDEPSIHLPTPSMQTLGTKSLFAKQLTISYTEKLKSSSMMNMFRKR